MPDIGLPPFLELFQCHLIPVNKPLRGLIHRLFELRLPHLDTEFEQEIDTKLGELLGFIQRTATIEIWQGWCSDDAVAVTVIVP